MLVFPGQANGSGPDNGGLSGSAATRPKAGGNAFVLKLTAIGDSRLVSLTRELSLD